MSFLASLVARAVGVAPVVQPRLPSRYESNVPDDVGGDAGAVEATNVAAPPPRTVAANVAAPLHSQQAIDPHIVESHSSETLVEHHFIERERNIEDGAVRELVQPAQAGRTAPPASIVERQIERPREHDTILREAVHASPSAALPTTQVVEHVHAPAEAARPANPPAERVRIETIDQATLAQPDAPLRPLLAPRQETSIVARESARVRPSVVRERVAAQEAPTIRVTIGRVDVRAIAAPATTSPPPPPRKPAFTIEDYIRLRKEGRR